MVPALADGTRKGFGSLDGVGQCQCHSDIGNSEYSGDTVAYKIRSFFVAVSLSHWCSLV